MDPGGAFAGLGGGPGADLRLRVGKTAPTQRTLERLAAGVGLPYGYVESLLPLFRSARRTVEGRPASGDPEEIEAGESFVEETARAVGERVRVTLVSYLMELEAMVGRGEGEEAP